MKRFVLFAGEGRPLGGFEDLKGHFDDIQKAEDFISKMEWLWYNLLDTKKWEIVSRKSFK